MFVDIFGEEGPYEFYIGSDTSAERNGVYRVKFIPPKSDAMFADISFNSQKLPRKWFLDSFEVNCCVILCVKPLDNIYFWCL